MSVINDTYSNIYLCEGCHYLIHKQYTAQSSIYPYMDRKIYCYYCDARYKNGTRFYRVSTYAKNEISKKGT